MTQANPDALLGCCIGSGQSTMPMGNCCKDHLPEGVACVRCGNPSDTKEDLCRSCITHLESHTTCHECLLLKTTSATSGTADVARLPVQRLYQLTGYHANYPASTAEAKLIKTVKRAAEDLAYKIGFEDGYRRALLEQGK